RDRHGSLHESRDARVPGGAGPDRAEDSRRARRAPRIADRALEVGDRPCVQHACRCAGAIAPSRRAEERRRGERVAHRATPTPVVTLAAGGCMTYDESDGPTPAKDLDL